MNTVNCEIFVFLGGIENVYVVYMKDICFMLGRMAKMVIDKNVKMHVKWPKYGAHPGSVKLHICSLSVSC